MPVIKKSASMVPESITDPCAGYSSERRFSSWVVLPWNMVDNSSAPYRPTSGRFFMMRQFREAFFPGARLHPSVSASIFTHLPVI
jgi:hypothetical protein